MNRRRNQSGDVRGQQGGDERPRDRNDGRGSAQQQPHRQEKRRHRLAEPDRSRMLAQHPAFPPPVAEVLPRERRQRRPGEVLAADRRIEHDAAARLPAAVVELVVFVDEQLLVVAADLPPVRSPEPAERHRVHAATLVLPLRP